MVLHSGLKVHAAFEEVGNAVGHHSVNLHPDVLREVALEVFALDEIDDRRLILCENFRETVCG